MGEVRITDEMVDEACATWANCQNHQPFSWLPENSKAMWRSTMRHILSAALSEPVGWQPIETAPRDRTPILLGYEGWLHPVVGFYAITLGCWVEHGTKDPKANMATKWMPLPDLHAALNPEGK